MGYPLGDDAQDHPLSSFTPDTRASGFHFAATIAPAGRGVTMLGSNRSIYPSHSLVDAVFRAVDAACIFTALLISIHSVSALHEELFWLVGAMATVLFYVIGAFCGMYRNWRGASVEREIMCGMISWLCTFVALLTIGYITALPENVSRATTVVWFFATASLIAGNRVVIRTAQRALRANGMNARRYAIVGVNRLAFQLAENIDRSPELGLKLQGFYDDRPRLRTGEVPTGMGECIGNLDQLIQAARDREVDLIYITFPMRAEQRIRDVLSRLADSTATVYIVPDFFVFELLHSRWTNIGGLPAVSIFEQPFYGVDGMVKRILDLLLTIVALILLALPMAIIALLISISSPGPVFFRQRRYGLDGREILVWKFRTMSVCEDGARSPRRGKMTRASRASERFCDGLPWTRFLSC